jgi:iron complex transport system substrate-binding protein
MKKITTLLAAVFLLATISCKNDNARTPIDQATGVDSLSNKSALKIVSLNGAVTEIVAALGHEKDIVGRDVTSTYPESVKASAKELGHMGHNVSIEGIMALKPTLILATEKGMTPDFEAKLKASGVKYFIFKQEFTIAGAKKLIAEVAGALNNANYKPLQDKIDADLKNVKPIANAPKVLFIYARHGGLQVSGTGTEVSEMIALANGKNAVTDFKDYKDLTPEALITGNPDVILLFNSGFEASGGIDGVLKIPGVDKTNAGKNKKIIAMDGGLLNSFGPRVGEAAVQLNALLNTNAK